MLLHYVKYTYLNYTYPLENIVYNIISYTIRSKFKNKIHKSVDNEYLIMNMLFNLILDEFKNGFALIL